MTNEILKVAVYSRNRPPGEQRPLHVLEVDSSIEDLRLRPRAVRAAVADVLRRTGYPVPHDGYQVLVLSEPAHGARAVVYLPATQAVAAQHLRKRPVRRVGPQGGVVPSYERKGRR